MNWPAQEDWALPLSATEFFMSATYAIKFKKRKMIIFKANNCIRTCVLGKLQLGKCKKYSETVPEI